MPGYKGTEAEVVAPKVDIRNLSWEEPNQKPLPQAIWKRPAFQGNMGLNDFNFIAQMDEKPTPYVSFEHDALDLFYQFEDSGLLTI